MATIAASVITITPAYGWVVVSATLMGLAGIAAGISVGSARRAVFKDEKFQNKPQVKAIRDAIKKDFPEMEWDDMGYPDMGNGILGHQLSPGNWVRINNAQRAHHNTLENLPLALMLVLTSGLFQPEVAAVCGLVYCIGRWLVISGYNAKGPKGRYPGSTISLLVLVIPLGINLFYGSSMALSSIGISLF